MSSSLFFLQIEVSSDIANDTLFSSLLIHSSQPKFDRAWCKFLMQNKCLQWTMCLLSRKRYNGIQHSLFCGSAILSHLQRELILYYNQLLKTILKLYVLEPSPDTEIYLKVIAIWYKQSIVLTNLTFGEYLDCLRIHWLEGTARAHIISVIFLHLEKVLEFPSLKLWEDLHIFPYSNVLMYLCSCFRFML